MVPPKPKKINLAKNSDSFNQTSLSPLNGREFARKMFGLENLNCKTKIIEAELEPGYRKKCIKLLSEVLGVSRHCVFNWSDGGLNFTKMPLHHQKFLSLYWKHQLLMKKIDNHNVLDAPTDKSRDSWLTEST